MEFNPDNRVSANDALAHSYFEGLHDIDDEPDFEGTIDASYEYDPKLTLHDVRILILKEINNVNNKNGEEEYNIDEYDQYLSSKNK